MNLFLASAGLPPSCNPTPEPGCIDTQLIVYKTYQTPVIGAIVPGSRPPVRDFCAVGTETRNVLIANIPSPAFIRPGVALPDQNASSPKNATLWLAPGELGRITLRIYDRDPNDNVVITKADGTQVSIDKRFDPRTKVTPGVAAQAVDQGPLSQDPPGATKPPIVTPNGTNMDYLWQPETAAVGELLGTTVEINEVRSFFPVSVRVWLNSGAPAVNTAVTMTLVTVAGAPVAGLSGNTLVDTDPVEGIATFGNLRVLAPGTYRLLATATASGATASGLSNVFTVGPPVVSFVQQPVGPVNVGAPIVPAVSVRVADAAGAVLPGVQVSLSLFTSTSGTGVLGGTTSALTNAGGLATFAGLSVSQPGSYLLRATATAPGVAATADSTSFTVASVTTPAQVFITNTSSLFNNEEQEVSVTTDPPAAATGVTVTYNGSPTVPTAIGAYNVVATANAPYTGSATATQTIASTLAAGGPGGGAYPPTGALSCGPGVFANGLRAAVDGGVNSGFGFVGYALTSGQLLCGDSNHPVKFGGGTTPNADLVCPADQVMVGFWGTTSAPYGPGAVVGSVSPRCQLPAGGAITYGPAPLPNAGGTPFGPIDCPPGQAVTGVVGGQGAVVDSIALVCGTLPVAPPAPTITSVSPASGAPGEGFLVVRGTGLPAVAGSQAVVTAGTTTANGFIFGGPSSPGAYWVRLPGGLPFGAATIQIQNGASISNTFDIDVSAAPGTPIITNVLNDRFVPTGSTFAGSTIYVQAEGTDTSGAVVRFQQGASIQDVSVLSTSSSPAIGLASQVVVPPLVSGPVSVSIQQGASAFSAPVVLSTQFKETVITGDSSILNDGVLIAANDLGDSPSAVTVNGVPFGTDQGGLFGSWQPQDPGDFSQDGFSATLDAVLSDLQFNNTLSPVNLTIGGLTPGASYRLQLLFSNDLNATGNRVNVTVQGATWVLDDWQPNPVNLTVQFTATSPSAVVTFAPGAGSDVDSGRAVLNGYVIHQMTP